MGKLLLRALLVTAWAVASTSAGRRDKPLNEGGKIVGGVDANIKDYPYQVSFEKGGRHQCGAAILSPSWALTAAHCVEGGSTAGWALRAGTSTREVGGSLHPVTAALAHPQYGGEVPDYDLALLKVGTPFVFGEGVAAVVLPSVGRALPDGAPTNVSGWGTLWSGGSLPRQLQVVEVPIVKQTACQAAYKPLPITERMVCAGYTTGGKDSCQGDSGGPMVAQGELVGVVSWGQGCALPQYPGVYARVSEMRAWVANNTGL